jgi:uncharacterized membrane protein YciS (DUF1049 family)
MQTVRRLMALALFAGLFVVAWRFASTNDTEIPIDLLLIQAPAVPIWMALLIAFGAGLLLASVSLGYKVLKKNLVARRYRKEVKGLESEIHQLRNLPLSGTGSALASEANAEAEDGEGGGIASPTA